MPAENGGETPKLHIDSDWKSQAKAEKERLAKQEAEKKRLEEERKAAAASAGPAGGMPGMMGGPGGAAGPMMGAGPGGGPGGEHELPEANFETLVSSIASQAIMCLGAYVDPQTNAAIVDLEAGRLHIDLLGVLEEKTKGNLTEDENKLLSGLLYELRMRFVEIARAAATAAKRGQAGGGAGLGEGTAGFVGPGSAGALRGEMPGNLGDFSDFGDFGSTSSFNRD